MESDVIDIADCCDPVTKELKDKQNYPRVDNPISYSDFFEKFLLTNRPCIIGDFVSSDWKSRVSWIQGDKPKWEPLKANYGDATVPVANCQEREYNAQKKTTSTLLEYLSYLEQYADDGYPITAPCLYLKDWHFTQDFPNACEYRVPRYFASDWLNEYFSSRSDLKDDYRFVYIGPKGSWTPLHADVFTSYSWSVNVVGRKRWLIFPPGQEIHLRDRFGSLAYDATAIDDCSYPEHHNVHKRYDIIQEAGEAIFIPSGWHHQVWNLEDTISINHNWVNGSNIRQMWFALKKNLEAVKKEINDCRDMEGWESHCQLMLRALHGLDYREFYELLLSISKPRIVQLQEKKPLTLYGGWQLGAHHAAWDLRQVLAALHMLLNDDDVQSLPWVQEVQPDLLMLEIMDVLQ